jgi:twitching motility protein PilT
MAQSLLSAEAWKKFATDQEMDCAINFGSERFRVNFFYQQETVAAAFRLIPQVIPSVTELGLPPAALALSNKARGLILVTGPTGSGKTTTLASMIDLINESRSEHIITVEDPIEFIHHSKKSLIVQREVEKDTRSFAAALKRILRQDPDVVLIGEMRDLETIQAAITIAETGHLVLATLHTNSAIQTINRIVDVFPAHQQTQVRTQLSFILEGILSQQLIPKTKGGRAMALELLIPTPAIRNLIREEKIHQIYAQMQLGQQQTNMQTMTQALVRLFKEGSITKEQALSYATELEEIKRLLPA